MNDKERAAMQQALEIIENHLGWGDGKTATALREALDHSGEANERVLTGLKITNKHGQLEFDPVYHEPAKRPQNCGTGYCSCIECPYEAEQAEQTPVSMPKHEDFCYCGNEISLQMVSGGAAPEGLYGRVTLKVCDKYVDYYAAPPRTKDLTDEQWAQTELFKLAVSKGLITIHTEQIVPTDTKTKVSWMEGHATGCDISNEAARAVIAADREKNK